MSSGLCVDCELKGALYRASRAQFERAVLVERRTKTQQSNDKTNNTLSPSRGEDSGQHNAVAGNTFIARSNNVLTQE